MLLTESMSNSCRNFLEVLHLVMPLVVSKPVLVEAMTNVLLLTAMSSLGSVAQPGLLLLGNNEAVRMIVVGMTPAILVQQATQHHGQEIVAVAIIMGSKMGMMLLLLGQALRHGSKLLPHIPLLLQVAMLAIPPRDMVLATPKQIWVLLQVSLPLQD